jgi:nucleotide-binding universal stress UspA family protein
VSWRIAPEIGLLALAVFTLWLARRRHRAAPEQIPPGATRILFPFVGSNIASETLDAALRIARAEDATLVPAYIAVVPMHLPLDAALPGECESAVPVLETIEQRAARTGVPVDSRIETARSARHALHQLLEGERFDRLVVPAATSTSEGLTPDDIAWLLESAPGEILVLRPGNGENGGKGPNGRPETEPHREDSRVLSSART